jgi:hypothetical protein
MEENSFVIPPPPPGTPEVKANPPTQDSSSAAPLFGIGAAPGAMPQSLADSATHKLPSFPRTGPVLGAPPTVGTPLPSSIRPPAAQPPAAQPPAEPPAASEALADETLAAAPARAAAPSREWSLSLPDGRSVSLTTAVLLGRDPIAQSEWPGAALIPVTDEAKSVSKTHAMFATEGDEVVVMDLYSTNGVVFIDPLGTETAIEPGVAVSIPVESVVELGRYRVSLVYA